MSAILSQACFKCGTALTSPSPVVQWNHGTSINSGMTVEFRGGVGSLFESHIFVGAVCDLCAHQLATMAGQLTSHRPAGAPMPVGTNMIDAQAEPAS
jgi:hypothetical protein